VTDQDPVQDFIEHFGVKGMKWGVRNDKSAASKLSTNARTNGKDAYPGLSTKKSGHAGDKLSTSKAKKNTLRNFALDKATAGFHKRARAHSARRTLKKLEGKSANTSTFRGRRKQRKINEAKVNAALQYALAKPRKTLYVTQAGQVSTIKGKKLAKQILKSRNIPYDDIRIRP
jgi:hypothetical protein